MEYKEIKVYLHTNLEELQENKRTILFESSKLIHPDVKNRTGLKKYPSVSFRMRQNYAALSELNFNQKMQFFFNTGSHLSLLRIYPNLFDKETNPYDESNPTKFFKEYNDIIKDNVMSMLQILFIASPLNGINVTSSWEFVIDKMTIPSLPTVYGFLNGISHNSMLDVNGKQYSFDRLVWMNDILNCPVYAELFVKYREFIRWRDNEIKKLEASGKVNTDEKADIGALISPLRAVESAIQNFLLKFRELPENQPNNRGTGPWPPVEGETNNENIKITYDWVLPLAKIKAAIQYLSEENATVDNIKSNVKTDLKTTLQSDDKYKFIGINDTPSIGFNPTSLRDALQTLIGYAPPVNGTKSGTMNFSYVPWTNASNRKVWRGSQEYKPYEYDQIQPAIDNLKTALDNYFNAQTTGSKNSDTIRKRIAVLKDLLNKSYDNVREEYRSKLGRDRDAQYSYFVEQYIRSRLSYANKSTNTLLQNLINLQTDKETKRFFEFVNRAFEYYYEGKGAAFKENEDDANYLYCGVNSKYEGNNLAPIYEIHVLCDLYFGPSGNLYGKQNCNQKGLELGKNLELVLTQNVETLEKNRQKWDLNYRRIMYSPSDNKGAQTNDQKQGVVNQERAPNENINANIFQEIIEAADNARKATPEQPVTSDITHWVPKTSISFLDAINGYYNQYSELRDERNYTKENILLILKDSKDSDERSLYEYFVDFNKNLYKFSQNLLDKLVRQIGIYGSVIEQSKLQQDEYIRVHPSRFNDIAYVKLSLKCEKNYLYKNITEELARREKLKPRINMLTAENAAVGGRKRKTKKARVSKKRFTRRNNYSRLR